MLTQLGSYAASFTGWFLAAMTNNHMLKYLDTGAILAVGALLQLLAHVLRFWNPPFGLFATSFFLSSLGMAYQDSHSNTFVSTINSAHRWLGFIHAMYALGALVSPFVATPIAAARPERWSIFYLFLVGLGAINLVAVIFCFWDTMRILKTEADDAGTGTRSRGGSAMRGIADTLKLRVVWIFSLFFFFSLGVGITAGGWVVQYLVTVRNGKLSEVGYTPAGLFGGIFLGRVLLVEPTHRLGPGRMIMIYCVMILALQLIFWLVPNIIASATALSLLGFFFGPFFPVVSLIPTKFSCSSNPAQGISVATKLFPSSVHASALGQ